MKDFSLNIKFVLKATLMVAFFNLNSFNAHAISFHTDTLIIDGKEINIEVKEASSESQNENEENQEKSPEKKNEISRYIQLRAGTGININLLTNNSDLLLVDEFVGRKRIPGISKFVGADYILKTESNKWFGIGLNYTEVDYRVTTIPGELPLIFDSYLSENKGELFQINRIVTQQGAEFDTLNVDLSRDIISLEYFGLALQCGSYFKHKKESKSKWLYGTELKCFYLMNGAPNRIQYMNGEGNYPAESSDYEARKGLLSLGLMFGSEISIGEKSSLKIVSTLNTFIHRLYLPKSSLNIRPTGVMLELGYSFKLSS